MSLRLWIEKKRCTLLIYWIKLANVMSSSSINLFFSHGVAACAKRGYFVHNYISKYYTIETFQRTYVAVMHVIGSLDSWTVPADVKSWVVKEPIVRKLPSWSKKKKIESNGKEPSRPKCSRCGQAGYNRKTCCSALPARSTLSQSGNTSTRRSRRRTQAQ